MLSLHLHHKDTLKAVSGAVGSFSSGNSLWKNIVYRRIKWTCCLNGLLNLVGIRRSWMWSKELKWETRLGITQWHMSS